MSVTTTIVLSILVPLLLSGFLNHFAHKNWILYFPLIGIALAILYFGHLGISSLNKADIVPPKERPDVIFRTTSVRPLAVGQYPIIQYELENIGTVRAKVVIKNFSCWFTPDMNQRLFEYPSGVWEAKSILAPSQKLLGQVPFDKHILTKDEITALNQQRGRLIFFAQGEYTDEFGAQTYQLPFCRMYYPDIVGNVIFCEDYITFREIGNSDK